MKKNNETSRDVMEVDNSTLLYASKKKHASQTNGRHRYKYILAILSNELTRENKLTKSQDDI